MGTFGGGDLPFSIDKDDNVDMLEHSIKNVSLLDNVAVYDNIAYANQFSGADISEKITAAFAAGYKVVRVRQQDSAYTWKSKVSLGSRDVLIFDAIEQVIEFTGLSGGGSGSSDIALELNGKAKVIGGEWQSTRASWDTANPWYCIQIEDASNNTVRDVVIRYFEYGLYLHGSTSSCLYNDINMRIIINCYRGIYLYGENNDINENNFHVNRISVGGYSNGEEIGVYLHRGTGGLSGNKFWSTSIEGYTTGNPATPGNNSAMRIAGARGTLVFGGRVESWHWDYYTEDGDDATTPNNNYVIGTNATLYVNRADEKSLRFIACNHPKGQASYTDDYPIKANYHRITETTTVTIGTGQDYDSLQDAIYAYQGAILEASLTFQLQENLSIADRIHINNFISAGGRLIIDTNTYNIVTSSNVGLNINHMTGAYIEISGGGTIESTASSGTIYLIRYRYSNKININDIVLKYGGTQTSYGLYLMNADAHIQSISQDGTDKTDYTIRAHGNVHISEDAAIPSGGTGARSLIEGAMAVDSDGTIYTEAGSVTPT